MNILLIGNGFDLAHKLPTKYTDFLEWVRELIMIGEQLAWTEEIPSEKEDADLWLNNDAQPSEWKIRFDDKLLKRFLKMGRADQKFYVNKYKLIKVWLRENRIYYGGLDDVGIEDTKLQRNEGGDERIEEENSVEVILDVIKILNGKEKYNERVNSFFERQAVNNESRHSNKISKKIFYLIKENVWIKYFLDNLENKNETWIDFESEISNVIKAFDEVIDGNLDKAISTYPSEFWQDFFRHYLNEEYSRIRNSKGYEIKQNAKRVIEKLQSDLEGLILLLEIYLYEYVKDIRVQVVSPDIKDLAIDHVLSFNYTDTYRQVYDTEEKVKYDYIHGKTGWEHIIEANNMVLGIDEYLADDRRNRDIEFIAFKKYYQRIYKATGCRYREWVEEIQSEYQGYMEMEKNYIEMKKNAFITNNEKELEKLIKLSEQHYAGRKKHNLYIFGHSLDVTDRDVLRDLILADNVHTTIFYRNQEQRGQQIANLVKVIGQDELIRRTGGCARTIEFKLQQNMVENK